MLRPASRGFPPAALLFAPVLVLIGCNGGGGDTGPADAPAEIAKPALQSGDMQKGTAGELLAAPLRVIVTREGIAVPNVEVTWSTEDGGELTPPTSTSRADGSALTEWVLGPRSGSQTATATVTENPDATVQFTAEAESSQPPNGAVVQVLSDGNRFLPADVTVVVNEPVTWIWPEGSVGHNVVPDDGSTPAPSGVLESGPHTYVYTFTATGVYRYYCEAHGGRNGSGMSGTVTVLETAP